MTGDAAPLIGAEWLAAAMIGARLKAVLTMAARDAACGWFAQG